MIKNLATPSTLLRTVSLSNREDTENTEKIVKSMDNNSDILKSIEQDAQVKQERMPMQINQTEAAQVSAKLSEFLKEREIHQIKFARMIGVGTAQLNQFLKNKYKGKLDTIINKVLNMMESMGRKERRVKGVEHVQTSVAKGIAALITRTEAFSDEEGKIGLLIGDGGHGKSHCLRQYAQANKNTIYVELDSAMTSTTMFAEIAKALNIDSSGTLGNVTRRLIESLLPRRSILMLDEASWLSVHQLDQLRQIISIKSKCPMILAGNKDLFDTVMQNNSRRGYESLDQFTSRLSYILNLDEKGSSKDGGLYTVEDIRKLYEYGGIRLTGDAVNTLRKICRSPRSGRLRTCTNIILALHISPQIIASGVIDSVAIVSAIEQLGLPVNVWLPVGFENVNEEQEEQAVAKIA